MCRRSVSTLPLCLVLHDPSRAGHSLYIILRRTRCNTAAEMLSRGKYGGPVRAKRQDWILVHKLKTFHGQASMANKRISPSDHVYPLVFKWIRTKVGWRRCCNICSYYTPSSRPLSRFGRQSVHIPLARTMTLRHRAGYHSRQRAIIARNASQMALPGSIDVGPRRAAAPNQKSKTMKGIRAV